jgi:capsular polysaccharide biosynthesis protein
MDALIVLAERYKSLSFVTDSLRMLGWNYRFYSDNSIIKSPVVYVPEMTAGSGSQRPVYFNAMKSTLLTAAGCDDRLVKAEMIFISRQSSPTRRLSNWDEVKAVLDRCNVRIVELETLSLLEQIRLLHSTSVLIGVHGAGLTNMCFMPGGTHVVEIRRHDDKLNFCYYKMANTCGLKYYYLLATSENGETSSIQADDFIAVPEDLERLLHTIQFNK